MADAEEEKMSPTNLPVLPSLAGNSVEGAKDSDGLKQHGFRHEEKKKQVVFTKDAKCIDGNKAPRTKKTGDAGTGERKEMMYVPKKVTAEKTKEHHAAARTKDNISATQEERKNSSDSNTSNNEGNASV
jgi:hypothetical protein